MAINLCIIQLIHSFISFGHCKPSDDDQCLICFLSCPSTLCVFANAIFNVWPHQMHSTPFKHSKHFSTSSWGYAINRQTGPYQLN